MWTLVIGAVVLVFLIKDVVIPDALDAMRGGVLAPGL